MTAILDFIVWLAGLFGLGKNDERNISHDQGLAQGKAETERDAALGELHAIDQADRARRAVGDDDLGGLLRDENNGGPAKPR